ncbi:MAG: sugar kinase [Candidatus Omnitrophica bacterium]|nr:sugar kinase [Candidatus Omnitrophota bacterium]MCL4733711.1 sugar kinase [Candidatus Omnitrophota bacterium]NUP92007.1 sugar kinase [Candidatus Omnitrophota bacterium]
MIVVVGSIALDSIETPTDKAEEVLGGSATFICASASRLAPTAVIGIVGDDFPNPYRELFQKWCFDVSGLAVSPGRTFRWGCRYHPDMIHRDTLFTELGVFESFSPLVPAHLRGCPYVGLGNIHPLQQMQVLDQMDHPEWVVADTMKLWIDIAREDLDRLIGRVNALVINDEEARQLTGCISLAAAAEHLLAMGPAAIIIKRGEHGASLHTRDGQFYSPAFPLASVKDTTGAGDTFLGGLVGWIAHQKNCDVETIKQGISIGSCLASFTVESSGVTRLDSISRQEIQARLDGLENLVRVQPFVID